MSFGGRASQTTPSLRDGVVSLYSESAERVELVGDEFEQVAGDVCPECDGGPTPNRMFECPVERHAHCVVLGKDCVQVVCCDVGC